MGPVGKDLHHRSLAWDILRAIGYGAIAASLFVAPNIGVALAPFLRDDPYARREWRRERVREALRRLRERRLVRFEERGKKTYLVVTELGKQRLRTFDFNAMGLATPPKRWDARWRMVIFDIPNDKKRERELLRRKLVELGFLALQKSVFIYPYPCEDEVDFLCNFLDIDRYVHFLEVHSLGSAEGRVRRAFDLL